MHVHAGGVHGDGHLVRAVARLFCLVAEGLRRLTQRQGRLAEVVDNGQNRALEAIGHVEHALAALLEGVLLDLELRLAQVFRLAQAVAEGLQAAHDNAGLKAVLLKGDFARLITACEALHYLRQDLQAPRQARRDDVGEDERDHQNGNGQGQFGDQLAVFFRRTGLQQSGEVAVGRREQAVDRADKAVVICCNRVTLQRAGGGDHGRHGGFGVRREVLAPGILPRLFQRVGHRRDGVVEGHLVDLVLKSPTRRRIVQGPGRHDDRRYFHRRGVHHVVAVEIGVEDQLRLVGDVGNGRVGVCQQVVAAQGFQRIGGVRAGQVRIAAGDIGNGRGARVRQRLTARAFDHGRPQRRQVLRTGDFAVGEVHDQHVRVEQQVAGEGHWQDQKNAQNAHAPGDADAPVDLVEKRPHGCAVLK